MRFLTYYVDVTKCLLDTKEEQNPNQTVLLKKLKGTQCDAYTRQLQSHYAAHWTSTRTYVSHTTTNLLVADCETAESHQAAQPVVVKLITK